MGNTGICGKEENKYMQHVLGMQEISLLPK